MKNLGCMEVYGMPIENNGKFSDREKERRERTMGERKGESEKD